MSKQFQLSEKLLSKTKQQPASKEAISIKWLTELFESDNIKDHHSNIMIDRVQGYEGLEKKLRTSLKTGITATIEDKEWRIQKFGRNDPIVKAPKTFFEMVMQNFQDRTIQILCFAATASLILGIATHGLAQGWIQGFSILLAVFIVASVTSVNNYMKQKQFRKLNEVASRKNINVTRNGEIINMSVYELLVGDIVQVETGEIISVDGIIFNNNKLYTDESSITGESKSIRKDDYATGVNNDSFLLSGSKVVEGTGMMIVLAVGVNSTEGKLRKGVQKESDFTPLQQKLAILADDIGEIGMKAGILTFGALALHLFYDLYTRDDLVTFSAYTLNALVDYFIIAVSIIVMVVPEGLPLAVTISLAYSVSKMKDQNNLVRFLAACETMGGANNICTDKTGTLTKNQMTVTKLWSEQRVIDKFSSEELCPTFNTKSLLCLGVCLNSNAHPKIKPTGAFEQIGNKTECALMQMAYKYKSDFRKLRTENKIINSLPFNSITKKMSTICMVKDKYFMFSKGAPDVLIEDCNRYLDKEGGSKPIDQAYRRKVETIVSEFASKSLRTILIAYRQLTKEQAYTDKPEKYVSQLIAIGITGIQDPLKDLIPEAVFRCKKAGITVRMVTGDYADTAIAIAKEAQIIPSTFVRPEKGQPGYYVVMEGKQFRTLCEGVVAVDENTDHIKNIEVFEEISKQLRVLSRSSPSDKYILATGLKQLGHVVAMTGDGANDAPALKKADIGFAMGIAGQQIAKQAAGIILLDDNFGSIITAVKYGRNIFDCIRKFLQFQLTVNIVGMIIAFVGALILKESPLMPVQILWVNLIMDTLAALALATEPPKSQLLDRMPYSRHQSLITYQMWRGIVVSTVFQLIILMGILFEGDKMFGVPDSIGLTNQTWNNQNGVHLTMFFNVFVFLQVFNFFNARTLKRAEINVFQDISDNYLFILIVIGIFITQIFIVQFGGKAFWLVPLNVQQHLICILIGALSLVMGFINKRCIPESIYSNFELLKEQQHQDFYDVDAMFKKLTRNT